MPAIADHDIARFHAALAAGRLRVHQGRFERVLRLVIQFGCRAAGFHLEVRFVAPLPGGAGGRTGRAVGRPGAGCVVVVAPHRAWIEPFLLLAAWPSDAARLVWLADGPTVTRSWWRRLVLPRLGVIPIEGSIRGPSIYAVLAAEVLAAGAAVAVFPESGPPSPPDRTRPIKPGFAYMARRAGAPVVPVVVAGTHHIVRGSTFDVRFLEAIETGEADPDSFARDSRARAHELTHLVAAEIESRLPDLNALTDARRPEPERWRWLGGLFR